MQKNITMLVFIFFFSLTMTRPLAIRAEQQENISGSAQKDQVEKVRKRVETLKMWKLTEALNLDEKTTAVLFPLLNKYDKKRAELENALREGMRELKEGLKDKNERRLAAALDKLEQNNKGMQKLKEEEWAELKKALTVEQQAKLVIFQQDFNREMKKMIAQAKEKRSEGGGKEKTKRPALPEKP